MSFQSFWFAAFLLLTLCLYYAVPAGLRLWVLLTANAVFFLWADLTAGVWLLFSIATTWAAGLWLEKERKKGMRRLILLICLLINLGLLVIFKYLPVWDAMANQTVGKGIRTVRLDVAGRFGLAAPLGISFYTLQAVGYLLDLYHGKYGAEKNPARYAVFVSFFPNILSGPIERGQHFLSQLDEILVKKRRELFVYDRIAQGLISMLLGYFMKMVIADRAAILVNYLYSVYQDGNSFTMLMAALFYAVQIYCDFASYSCIAVGVARIMGFELIRNFRQPYFAVGISDFWRRWHISLSSWLKDYIYIPLGGNRKGVVRKEINLVIVFLVSGLWHGGSLPFLLWGFFHGLCLAAEDLYKRMKKFLFGDRKLPFEGVRRLLAGIFTFLAVCCLWIFFRSETPEMAFVCLKNLFTRWQGFLFAKEFIFAMGLNQVEFLITAVSAAVLLAVDVVSEKKKTEASAWIYASPLVVRWTICLLLIGMVFVFGMYGPGFDASGFIYVNF